MARAIHDVSDVRLYEDGSLGVGLLWDYSDEERERIRQGYMCPFCAEKFITHAWTCPLCGASREEMKQEYERKYTESEEVFRSQIDIEAELDRLDEQAEKRRFAERTKGIWLPDKD